MIELALSLIGLPTALLLYAYVCYPAGLWLLGRSLPRYRLPERDPEEWPWVSVSLPAYNEEAQIGGAIEALLQVDYPRQKLQIVVVSDASSDRTDEIVRGYEDRGVELLRVEERGGKTAAENVAIPRLRGEIVVNTDASIRILPDAFKPLVRAFQDPLVGVASGRDISVDATDAAGANVGESGYVGYEMAVRGLETRLGGIVGASGCFYAIRRELHAKTVPGSLSRDFASALVAREHGYRSVSVDEARALVPRAGSLRSELRRKARTMTRGLETLCWKRHLLNPLRYGGFAVKLFSHKLARWLVNLTLPLGAVGALLLALALSPWLLATVLLAIAVGGAALVWPPERPMPRPVALAGFGIGIGIAGIKAWSRLLRGREHAVWEPTRR